MKKRILILILTLVLAGIMFMGFGAPAKAAELPKIKLRFSSYSTEPGPVAQSYVDIMNTITKRTNGRVEFEKYFMGTLIPNGEEVRSVVKGVADIAFVNSKDAPRLPLINVAYLPGIGGSMKTQGHNVVELAKMPAIQQEFDQNNIMLLSVQGGDSYYMWFTKEIKAMDEMKGRKVRVTGDPAKLISQYGAICINMPGPDMTEAFQKGTLDGSLGGFGGAIPQGHHKLCHWLINYPIVNSLSYLIMSKASWAKLPADIQNMFKEEFAKHPQHYIELFGPFEKEVFQKTLPEAGCHVVEITAAEKAKLAVLSRPVWDSWVAAREKEGMTSARDVLNKMLQLNGIK